MDRIIEFIKVNEIGDYKENISIKNLTTYKVGGLVRLVVFPKNADTLIRILMYLKENNISFKIFGNGSNILASDKDYDGVIIKLNNFHDYEIDEHDILTVDAGYNLLSLANSVSRLGYSGLEFATGIPGTIGGSIYMNAGAYLKSMSDIVIDIDVLDENLNIITIPNQDLEFGYRKSLLNNKKYICLKARLQLEKKDPEEIQKLISDRKERRLATQPLEYPSAGSVFRNPLGDYAGRLIEECDLKGFEIGGASISSKHANFIINRNNAQANDIKKLIDKAKYDVKTKFGIDLSLEQEFFNWE